MGLELVRSIAEAHGESIEATPARPGPGTIFTLRFPVPEQPALD
ncbi:hypothetical protein [Delftia acidovorans]